MNVGYYVALERQFRAHEEETMNTRLGVGQRAALIYTDDHDIHFFGSFVLGQRRQLTDGIVLRVDAADPFKLSEAFVMVFAVR